MSLGEERLQIQMGFAYGKITLPYKPIDAIEGRDHNDISPLCIDDVMPDVAIVFNAFKDEILTKPELNSDQGGRQLADFVFYGLLWISVIGLTFGMNRLGLTTKAYSAEERKKMSDNYDALLKNITEKS